MASAGGEAQEAVVALAKQLGWRGSMDDDELARLARLLDDEAELLAPAERQALRGRVSPASISTPREPSHLVVCEGCGNLFLARFRPDDGRCRCCARPLDGAEEVGHGGGDGSVAGARARLVAELAGQADWTPLDRLGLGKPVQLDPDNEDWDQRLARIERERDEERRKVQEEAKRKAAEEEDRRRKAAEEAQRKAAEEEARRKAAEEEKRRQEEEERRRRQEAEEAARRQREAEEQARRAAEEAARKAQEEEERRRQEEEASAAAKAAAQMRPALGGILGPDAGKIVRMEDLPAAPALKPGEPSRVWISGDGKPRLTVAPGGGERVNGQKVEGTVELATGQIVTLGPERAYVVDQTGELEGVTAAQAHFVRADDKPGGPWPYWNETVRIGAAATCEVRLVDDGVDDQHAVVATRFGRIVLEDKSSPDDGIFVKGKRMRWLILRPGLAFSLGKDGAQLTIKEGEADLQPKLKEARAQKPTRHNRVLFEVMDENGKVIRKVFVFARRELRFGRTDRDPKTGKVINELALVPSATEGTKIATEQGGLNLTRDGVEVQRWRQGDAEMLLDDEPIPRGKAVKLQRHFTLQIGEGMLIDGRVFRSPSDVALVEGPPRLGIEGGHPFECVRLERVYTAHTYVFLVRLLRLGSGKNVPVRVDVPGVMDVHAQILLKDGKYLILAPKGEVGLEPPGQERFMLEPGIPAVLPINAKLHMGKATILFRTPSEADFEVGG